MSPFILVTLLVTLILGTLVAVSSSHWLIIWVGLELNTLAIIPLMLKSSRPRAVEAATKYFLIQAAAAATLLFAATTNAWLTGQWEISQMTHPASALLGVLALSMKLGLAPVHLWLPEVIQGLNLSTGLILSTWQKVAPFALLVQIPSPSPSLLVFLGMLSIFVGGWGGLNQTQLRKVLAYSSIAHLGWMILVIQFSPPLAIMTLVTYLMMTTSAFLTLNEMKTTSINSLAIAWAKNPALTATAPLMLLSLAGLPPLTGFIPKWLILQELTKQGLLLNAVVTALSALLSLFFYLRLAYVLSLTYSPNTSLGTPPWRLSSPQSVFPLAVTTSSAILLLPLTPLLYSLLGS